jgi:hypothetical protein
MDLIRTGNEAEPLLEALVEAAGMSAHPLRLDQI